MGVVVLPSLRSLCDRLASSCPWIARFDIDRPCCECDAVRERRAVLCLAMRPTWP